jgi:hypothetical protein
MRLLWRIGLEWEGKYLNGSLELPFDEVTMQDL